MSKTRKIPAAIALAAATALALSACGQSAGASEDSTTTTTAPNTVAVSLGDTGDAMTLTPTPAEANAGTVTFVVTNDGEREHEFVVFKTDLDIADLPFDSAADRVIENGDGLTSIDEIEGIQPGETKTLTVDLEAGHYALICNIERHYRLGMRAAFDVH